MAKRTNITRRNRVSQNQTKMMNLRITCLAVGAISGFVLGFAGRTIYFLDAYKIGSIFKWLLGDIFMWAFIACLIGGFLGFGMGILLEKKKIHKVT